MKLSAVIITFNEERNIADAIRTVDFADEILVVDSESTDRTREIAAELGAKVIVNPWPGFARQKQFAVDLAANDLILSIDADERIPADLRARIVAISQSEPAADGYNIPRLNYYMGRAIKHGDWYPDHQLRLFDRRKGRWNDSVIHESVTMDKGSIVETIDLPMLHYSVDGAAEHHKMIGERYAPLAARQMLKEGKSTSAAAVILRPWFSFIRSYLLKAGFLDGFAGFCIAYFAAHHTFMKYLLLFEMQKKEQ